MRQDSDMANQIMLGLARRGIVALPVHDSFLVKARHADQLREAMVSAFEQSTGKRVSDFPYDITS